MISFERLDPQKIDWESINQTQGINIFQTLPWINYLIATHQVEPVVAAVKSDGRKIGYYTGMITHKYGLKILGSPFRGWTTYFMGFNLSPEAAYPEVLAAFQKFAFSELKCHYLEIIDPHIGSTDCTGLSYRTEHLPWFAIDLQGSEDDLLARLDSKCRQSIRKAVKNGIVIEEASDLAFADEYFAQCQEVMANKSLVPAYGLDCTRCLLEQLIPTGNILLLRARNVDGACIATGIFLAMNGLGVGWGAASWRQYQTLHPNDLLYWYVMTNFRNRGVQKLHLGGECESFKKKFGSQDAQLYRLTKAKDPLIDRFLAAITSPKSSRYRNWMLRKL
jgi:CelD/BcsL family acetyltransferase involved in cellulose biosynthesis